MSSTLYQSSLLQDQQLCQPCNRYIQRQCPQKLACKLCQFIKALYLLDYQHTQKVLQELTQWRTCPKHLSSYQFYNSITKCMACAECTLEIISDITIELDQKFQILKNFELIDKFALIDLQQVKEGLQISPPNFYGLNSVLDQLSEKKLQFQEPDTEEKKQSLEEYKQLVDNYCEQSNLIRFQSIYGHCQTNKIKCIQLGFMKASRQEMSPNFEEKGFNNLIDKIKHG